MRRLMIALLLMVALPLAAQTFPPELAGPPIVSHSDVCAIYTDVLYCPWSMPEMPDDAGYLGEYEADLSSLTLTLDCWGRYPNGPCQWPAPAQYLNGKTLPWVNECGCYIETELRPDGLVQFVAVVTAERTPVLWEGCFDIKPGHPLPEFVFSESCILSISDLRYVPRAEMPLVEPAYE